MGIKRSYSKKSENPLTRKIMQLIDIRIMDIAY